MRDILEILGIGTGYHTHDSLLQTFRENHAKVQQAEIDEHMSKIITATAGQDNAELEKSQYTKSKISVKEINGVSKLVKTGVLNTTSSHLNLSSDLHTKDNEYLEVNKRLQNISVNIDGQDEKKK